MMGKVLTKFNKVPITVGDHIRKARIERQLFQREVADIIGISEDCLTNWENNRCSPQNKYKEKITLFLGYTPFKSQY